MSLIPESTAPESSTPESAAMQTVPEPLPAPTRRPRGWVRWLFVILTLGIGSFLIAFPWVDAWDLNSVQDFIPGASDIWDEPILRGGLTGLGFVNVYIGLVQFIRILRRKY
jgi:hypothetical protein